MIMDDSHEDSLLLVDSSNYVSWCTYIMQVLRNIDPSLLSIVDASIYPSNFDWKDYTVEEGKCMQHNAQAANAFLSAMSTEAHDLIFKRHGFHQDAHLLWKAIELEFSIPKSVDSIPTNLSNEDEDDKRIMDQIGDQNESGTDLPEKAVRPVSETGLTGFVCAAAPQKKKSRRRRICPPFNGVSSKTHQKCLMAKKNKRMVKRVESENESESEDLEFDNMSKRNMRKVAQLMEKLEEQEDQLETQENSLQGRR